MPASSSIQWYALYTSPRAEKKALRELSVRGFETYLPLLVTLRQWSDRKKKVEVPLFNSYIFVRTDLEKQYYNVLAVPGIVKFVRIGNEIPPLREEQIAHIRLLLANFTDLEVSQERIGLSEMVEIVAGPLKGIRGITIENQGDKTFALEVEQLGCSIKVNLPRQYLKKV